MPDVDALDITVTVLTVTVTAFIAMADFARADFVLANSAEVGVPPAWLPGLGGLKLAGAAGLVVGLIAVDALGVAAAAGLVAFFIGAVAAHIRAKVFHNIAFPLTYLGLSVASLAVAIAR